MTTREIAEDLVAKCNEGRHQECYELYYSPDCVSVEAAEMAPGAGRESVGMEAIQAKVAQWFAMTKMHGGQVTGPFLHGDDKFSVFATMDVEMVDGPWKGMRMKADEIGVYTLKDGKIIHEEFFSPPMDMQPPQA
jgi:hypothetical protein